MDTQTFGNLLIVLFVVLQLVNYIVIYHSFMKWGSKGVIGSACLLFVADVIILLLVKNVKVKDKNGKIKHFADIIFDVISVAIALFVTSLFLLIGGIAYLRLTFSRNGHDEKYGILIPVIATAIIYIAVYIGAKTKAKI